MGTHNASTVLSVVLSVFLCLGWATGLYGVFVQTPGNMSAREGEDVDFLWILRRALTADDTIVFRNNKNQEIFAISFGIQFNKQGYTSRITTLGDMRERVGFTLRSVSVSDAGSYSCVFRNHVYNDSFLNVTVTHVSATVEDGATMEDGTDVPVSQRQDVRRTQLQAADHHNKGYGSPNRLVVGLSTAAGIVLLCTVVLTVSCKLRKRRRVRLQPRREMEPRAEIMPILEDQPELQSVPNNLAPVNLNGAGQRPVLQIVQNGIKTVHMDAEGEQIEPPGSPEYLEPLAWEEEQPQSGNQTDSPPASHRVEHTYTEIPADASPPCSDMYIHTPTGTQSGPNLLQSDSHYNSPTRTQCGPNLPEIDSRHDRPNGTQAEPNAPESDSHYDTPTLSQDGPSLPGSDSLYKIPSGIQGGPNLPESDIHYDSSDSDISETPTSIKEIDKSRASCGFPVQVEARCSQRLNTGGDENSCPSTFIHLHGAGVEKNYF